MFWFGATDSFMRFMTFDVYGDGNSYVGICEVEEMEMRGSVW